VGVLLITHYTRILRYVTPDFVHVFAVAASSRRAALSWQSSMETRATSGS
jgi:Fe-S cluster assembly ATP-binding protein